MNSAHLAVLQEMSNNDGIEGYNLKMKIGTGEAYLKYAMRDDQLVWVDITLATMGDEDRSDESGRGAQLAATKLDNNKAMLELTCRSASALLQCGEWSAYDLIESWQGTHFDPSGVCPQVEGVVGSPCDAVARYFRRKGFCD